MSRVAIAKATSKSVAVALSGGVDSSVAATLLLEQGHDCAGLHLNLCGNEENADARNVSLKLGMPYHALDYRELFEQSVVRDFVESYLRGETPNPCIGCNRNVKFKLMLESARALDYDCIATGHYARREFHEESGRWLLKKAVDIGRDQSYMLCMLTQEQIAHCFFPLGELHKPQVRQIALESGLVNAKRRDSQDICFIPEGDYGDFIERWTGEALIPGDFLDLDGKVLGRHRGTPRYTLGQRKGLGLALPRPGYVCAIDSAQNTVTVGNESLLFSNTLAARELNWIAFERLDRPLRCKAKVRYRQNEQWAVAEQTGEKTLRVTFDEPQRAITPGQAVVLYDGDYVLGGAVIQPNISP